MAEEITRNKNEDDTEEHNHTGAEIGGIGGAVVGGLTGSMAGPVGTLVGAVIGGVVGAAASATAVNAIDKIDHDHTVSGLKIPQESAPEEVRQDAPKSAVDE